MVSGARTSLGRGPWQQRGRRRGRHKVQTFIRATCPLKLLRTRGSDRRAELRLTRGSGQPLSTARRPTGKSPARELRIGHSQDLGLPASALTMIIVSESSAKATQPVRTGRYTPARLRRSAAPSNTPRYADVLPISVYTEEVNRSRSAISNRASGGPCSGMAPGWARKWWVTRRRGYPVASAPRRSRSGVGVQLVQRVGCSSWTPTPDLLRGKPADATGYPLPYPYLAD